MRDALTAAREWGGRPLRWLRSPLSVGPDWSEADYTLAQALTLHDKDLCPGGCGFYLDETSHTDGHYRSDSVYCDACATRDQRDKDERDRQPGEVRFLRRD